MPVGKSGIELQYEGDLKGKPGKTLIFKMNNKEFLWNIQKVQKGKDIRLALDSKLQQNQRKHYDHKLRNYLMLKVVML